MSGPGAPRLVVGLISDTHGLLRPEALDALRGVDRILHAGDVGGLAVLDALAQLAPVTAVRGNTDGGDWARS
ncbi:MAG: metallophosphoesterase family protein, partial [Deltaproteobacteria bacterium]|nr:metallophosphoesterase family protein [Deltaproteobacteria bacterium]